MQMSDNVWSPLSIPLYRAMWIAITASNIGTWMNEVGVTWMMASLAASNLMLALIQTATTLPFLFLSYPAGAFADIFNRRKILLSLHVWMLLSASVLTVLTYQDLTTEWWLLILTFALATGNAMMRPAFSASIPSFVPKHELHSAITLNSLSTNASKAVGPAIGGLIISFSGPYVVFAINAISFVIITIILFVRFPSTIGIPSQLPAERFGQAMRSGIVYLVHDRDLRVVLLRCMVFFVFASAFWSLIPALLIRNFNATAQTYGIVMALTGIGSVVGAIYMPRLYKRWPRNTLFGVTSGVYGVSLILLAATSELWQVCLIAVLMGSAWIITFSALIVSCQLSVPDWVRARALAIVMVAYGLAAAPGSALWGYLADQMDLSTSLAMAGCGALATVLLGRWLPLNNRDRDHTPSQHWQAPPQHEIPHTEGPVTVSREYQIDVSQRSSFLRLMDRVRAVRKRNGALSWQLLESHPGVYIENIVITNWLDYLRQRERLTVEDRQLEEQIAQLNNGKNPPLTTHSVAQHQWSHTGH